MQQLNASDPDIFTADIELHGVSGQVHVLTGEAQHVIRIAKVASYLGGLSSSSTVIRYFKGEIGGSKDLVNETLAWVSPGQGLVWSFEEYGVHAVALDARLTPPDR